MVRLLEELTVELISGVWESLKAVRERAPLVHNITNYVVMNNTANALLAVGASPAMVHAREEVADFTAISQALVVNIGTLSPDWVEGMRLAVASARRVGVPWVLDPVGAGATAFRTQTVERLLSEIEIAVVCGNAGEIATLAGLSAEVRGVESLMGDAETAVRKAAGALGVTVAATGETDYVSDGDRTLGVSNGHPLMGRVVGSGCASTAVIGCFAAVGGGGVESVAEALAYYGGAGEVAAEGAEGGGTFEPRLLDALAGLAGDPTGLDDALRVKEVSGG